MEQSEQMEEVDDKSLIKKLYKDAFYQIIKNLDYKEIINLCNTSNVYQKYCKKKKVWFYLLKRDFNPLLQVDLDALDAVDELGNHLITAKQLYYRIQRESIEPVRVLYKKFKDKALVNLIGSIQQNYYGALWLLKEKRIDPSAEDNHAIVWACMYGHVEIVQLLLNDPRVDPSADHNAAIFQASGNGRVKIVRLLLNEVPRRVDPSYRHNIALIDASQEGHIEVVRLLLEDDRVDPSDQHNKAIMLASRNGYIEVVKLLLNDPRVRATLTAIQLQTLEEQINLTYLL